MLAIATMGLASAFAINSVSYLAMLFSLALILVWRVGQQRLDNVGQLAS